jgi:hypothetical protein
MGQLTQGDHQPDIHVGSPVNNEFTRIGCISRIDMLHVVLDNASAPFVYRGELSHPGRVHFRGALSVSESGSAWASVCDVLVPVEVSLCLASDRKF